MDRRKKNLQTLRKKWRKWLKAQRTLPLAARTAETTFKLDESVPNLSSIMLLVEAAGKMILLTGDGRGDDLLRGLAQVNLLDAKLETKNPLFLTMLATARQFAKQQLANVT